MATKTSKRAGETATTVSVGVRIDPKIKFALDIMGRLQKRSLTAVIEWAISQAIAQQDVKFNGPSVSEFLDDIWSTDESLRFINMCFAAPEVLTYDELRVWDTIKFSPFFWDRENCPIQKNYFNFDALRNAWDSLRERVEKDKNSSTIKPYSPFDDDIDF